MWSKTKQVLTDGRPSQKTFQVQFWGLYNKQMLLVELRSLLYYEYWEAYTKAGAAACAYASEYGFMDVENIMLCIHK